MKNILLLLLGLCHFIPCRAQERSLDSVSLTISDGISLDSLRKKVRLNNQLKETINAGFQFNKISQKQYDSEIYQILFEELQNQNNAFDNEELNFIIAEPFSITTDGFNFESAKDINSALKIEPQEFLQSKQEVLIVIEDEKEKNTQKPSRPSFIKVELGAQNVNQIRNVEKPTTPKKRLRGPSQYDSRIEIRALNDDEPWQYYISQISKSVGIIVPKERIHPLASGIYQIDISQSLEDSYEVCEKTAFSNQPVFGVGTAFVVGENSMLSAAHVFNRPLSEYAIVFGYELLNSEGTISPIVHKDNLFFIDDKPQILHDLDVIKFKVTQKMNREKLFFGSSMNLEEKHEIYMLGYPLGLPLKVTLNAGITQNQHHQFFLTSLDSFSGNSGSPVFDFYNNKIIGILVSGEIDFELKGDCYVERKCRPPYCEGEKVIRIEQIINRLNHNN